MPCPPTNLTPCPLPGRGWYTASNTAVLTHRHCGYTLVNSPPRLDRHSATTWAINPATKAGQTLGHQLGHPLSRQGWTDTQPPNGPSTQPPNGLSTQPPRLDRHSATKWAIRSATKWAIHSATQARQTLHVTREITAEG